MEEWKPEEITAHLDGAVGKGALGEYRLQAAIAALHDQAHTADDTAWRQILARYGLLEQLTRKTGRNPQQGRRSRHGQRPDRRIGPARHGRPRACISQVAKNFGSMSIVSQRSIRPQSKALPPHEDGK
jgi:hypothetical protein